MLIFCNKTKSSECFLRVPRDLVIKSNILFHMAKNYSNWYHEYLY